MSNSIVIQQFDINSMPKNSFCYIVAKRASGKSTLIKSILNNFYTIKNGIIISPNEKMAIPKSYSHIISNHNIYYQYDTHIVNKLLYKQEKLIKEKGINNNTNSLIVFDDCIASHSFNSIDNNRDKLFFNNKQYNLLTILNTQIPINFTFNMIDNIDYIFLGSEDIFSNRSKIYKYLCGFIPNYDMFNMIFRDLTKNFGFMVIDNKNKNKSLSERIFWYNPYFDPIYFYKSMKIKKSYCYCNISNNYLSNNNDDIIVINVNNIKLITHITILEFIINFDEYIDCLPSNITKIILSSNYNKNINNLPLFLNELTLLQKFNKKLNKLPLNLLKLNYDCEANITFLPFTVKELTIYENYKGNLDFLPESVEILNLHNYTKVINDLPSSVKQINVFSNTSSNTISNNNNINKIYHHKIINHSNFIEIL